MPADAEFEAVKVNVLVPVALAGLNAAVTPLGNPETVRFTLLLNPFCGAMVMVLVPLAPCFTVRLEGDADSAKLGAEEVTVRLIEVVLVSVPDTPVTISAAVAGAAELAAVKVNVLAPGVLVGLKDAVTPPGNPETDRLTLPLKPFCGLTVMVLAPLAPSLTDTADGDAERLNDGALARPVRSLIRRCPEGEPQPVTRS